MDTDTFRLGILLRDVSCFKCNRAIVASFTLDTCIEIDVTPCTPCLFKTVESLNRRFFVILHVEIRHLLFVYFIM